MILNAFSFPRSLIILIFLLFPAEKLWCQDTVFYSTSNQIFTVSFERSSTGYSVNGNEIIHELASDMIKPLSKTRITLGFRTDLKMVFQPAGNISLIISVRDPVPGGDLKYRKLDIRDALVPDKVGFRIWTWNRSDSASTRETNLADASFRGDGQQDYVVDAGNFNFDKDTIVLKRIFFYYDDVALNVFRERVQLVNDYYASSMIADSLLRMTAEMNMENTGLFPVRFLQIEELGKMTKIMRQKNFRELLDLDHQDPLKLAGKINTLYKFYLSARMTFEENLAGSGLVVSTLTGDSVIGYFLASMHRYIRWSQMVNDHHSRIYNEYLDSYFLKGTFEDDKKVIKDLLRKIFPDADPDSSCLEISTRIMHAYENKARSMILQQRHAEAFDLLRNEALFRTANPYLAGIKTDAELQTEAARGVFDSYISIADVCYQHGKYEMSRDYLLKAHRYQQKNSDLIRHDTLFREMFLRLFTRIISGCDSLATNGQFEEAIDCYHASEENVEPSLKQEVREIIAQKTGFATNGLLLDSAGRERYLAVLLKQILDGESLIWTEQYDKAQLFIDSVETFSRTMGFGMDPRVNESISKYRKTIGEKICWMVRESYEILLLRTDRDIELHFFLKAKLLLDSALLQARMNPSCGIDVAHASDTLAKYAPSAEFEKSLILISNDLTMNEFEKAVPAYIDLGNFYTLNKLQRFGLEYKSLYEFTAEKDQLQLTGSAMNYYLGKGAHREAFRYLQLLKKQGEQKNRTKESQVRLGKSFAEEDFKKDPLADPGKSANKYSDGDQWFGNFASSYVSAWKKLKKE